MYIIQWGMIKFGKKSLSLKINVLSKIKIQQFLLINKCSNFRNNGKNCHIKTLA